jgi:hypothetical protein
VSGACACANGLPNACARTGLPLIAWGARATLLPVVVGVDVTIGVPGTVAVGDCCAMFACLSATAAALVGCFFC